MTLSAYQTTASEIAPKPARTWAPTRWTPQNELRCRGILRPGERLHWTRANLWLDRVIVTMEVRA